MHTRTHAPIRTQIESHLDRLLGPTASSAARLLVGLVGCTLVTAAFPFLPSTHAALLWLTAALGTVRAHAGWCAQGAASWRAQWRAARKAA